MTGRDRHLFIMGIVLLAILGIAIWAESTYHWFAPAFKLVAHLFYEKSALAEIREPSQIPLARVHLGILAGLLALTFLASPWLPSHGRRWFSVILVAYAIRATIWIIGGNLPLVPGDSCHYIEVATSVYRGEGAVKHYVESFFRDYPPIRRGEGVLDDWATPLWAYTLAFVYWLTGVVPGRFLESTFAVAKGTSFVLNLLCLPAIYAFGRRRYGPDVGLGAMALLAVLPVHAIYAGFSLRESQVALAAILAVWLATEIWNANGAIAWCWAIAAGGCGGLAILARNTAMALTAAVGVFALVAHARRFLGPLLLWGMVLIAVIAPWAWVTYKEYGEPFYTYTKYFPYNFSWTIHHYQKGNTLASEFYTAANMPDIVRVKIKSLLIIATYSFMMLSFPVVLGCVHRWFWPDPQKFPQGRDADRLIVTILLVFVAATLFNVADVTQVQQLGRYYLPVYALMLPMAVAGLMDWLRASVVPAKHSRWYVATVLLLWAGPTWAHDTSWFVSSYQLHWPALRDAGEWVRRHPDIVPENARVMTWFPWEFRVTSQRTTVLFPRSYYPPHLERTIRDYQVNFLLWGSFEPPPDVDPEIWGPYLEKIRLGLGLVADRELYRSPSGLPYPVRLYRLGGGSP